MSLYELQECGCLIGRNQYGIPSVIKKCDEMKCLQKEKEKEDGN